MNKLFPPKKLGLWLANQLSQPIRGHIFWWERAWIPICPLCSFQKTVTLVSIYVFSSQYWGSTQSYRVYMKRNEFSPSYYTDLPFEAESGSIHSKWYHCGRESVWCQSVDILVKDLLLWNFSFFVSFKKRWVTLLQNSD